jgi:AP-2 complex subunit sigma-1
MSLTVLQFCSHDRIVLISSTFKVYSVVDEMFLAGEIRETSQTKVLKQLQTLAQQE